MPSFVVWSAPSSASIDLLKSKIPDPAALGVVFNVTILDCVAVVVVEYIMSQKNLTLTCEAKTVESEIENIIS